MKTNRSFGRAVRATRRPIDRRVFERARDRAELIPCLLSEACFDFAAMTLAVVHDQVCICRAAAEVLGHGREVEREIELAVAVAVTEVARAAREHESLRTNLWAQVLRLAAARRARCGVLAGHRCSVA